MTVKGKKTPAQLDREIAVVIAAGPSVTISVHEVIDDDDDESENDNDESDEDRYMISDDGGEFDDSEETSGPDVQGDIDERRLHYRAIGKRVVLVVPEGRGWQ
jgi:hypothetical protein